MNYYQEISLLHQAEIGIYFLWPKIYMQIHLALVENKHADNSSHVGVAFPEYHADKHCLGGKLRLFAKDQKDLHQMQVSKWLSRLHDYLQLSEIRAVPETDDYACFKHIKRKGSKEKLARRRAKRTGETLEQSLAHFEGYKEPLSKLPYIYMRSETTRHSFHLFIEKEIMQQPQIGLYSCYGLSNTSTVPLF
jgi:CRISPR-associated endonuclease Csy4